MEDGRYKAQASSWGLGYTKGGKPQIAIEMRVLDEEASGELITWYGYFTDAAKERTFSALRTLGWEGDDLANLNGLDKNEVSITVKSEEWEGSWTQKVAWINPLGGLGLKNPMTPEQAKSFAATMKGDAIASRGGTSKPASRPKPKAKPQQSDKEKRDYEDFGVGGGGVGDVDDIPF